MPTREPFACEPLTPHEIENLRANNLDPQDFAAILLPVISVQPAQGAADVLVAAVRLPPTPLFAAQESTVLVSSAAAARSVSFVMPVFRAVLPKTDFASNARAVDGSAGFMVYDEDGAPCARTITVQEARAIVMRSGRAWTVRSVANDAAQDASSLAEQSIPSVPHIER